MTYRKASPTHLLLLACLLVVGFIASAPTTTEAAVGGCRADPLVTLSDGTILDVSVDIGTAVSNVTEIHYIVHGPRGIKLVTAVSTPTFGFNGKESFTYYSDAQPNQYITETLVQTTYDQVAVTSYTTFASVKLFSGPLLSLQYKPIQGFNNQILRATLTR